MVIGLLEGIVRGGGKDCRTAHHRLPPTEAAMKLAALTLTAFGLVLAVLFCFTGPISRILCPVLDDTKSMLGQGAVEFPKPDFGLVSSLGSLMPPAC